MSDLLGIRCPECRATQNMIRDTRTLDGAIRRYRLCRKCGHQYTTLETAVVYIEGAYQAIAQKVTPIKEPIRRTSIRNFWPVKAAEVAGDLAGMPDELQEGLLNWWNEARRSKHKTAATWTPRAFSANASRLLALHQGNPARAIELVAAGQEFGWQALNVDYLQGCNKPAASLPSLGLGPRDPAMQAAVNQWQTTA